MGGGGPGVIMDVVFLGPALAGSTLVGLMILSGLLMQYLGMTYLFPNSS